MVKILLSLFFIGGFYGVMGQLNPVRVEHNELQSVSKLQLPPCICTPDYAGEDKVTCKQIPAQSVQIGCTLDATNPLCSDLCFLWSPAAGLNPADKMKSDPLVNPTVTTMYTVTVKNSKLPAPGIIGTYDVFVYVVEMQLILYKPKVIAGNTTTPASIPLGAQTFVNLDNDDNDTFYDDAKFEPATGGVIGGDDELVRAELRLKPIDLPDKMVRLVATQGAGDIKVWTDESKSGAEYLLNTDVALSLDGAYLKKDLWIEGRLAHSVQKGTMLKMTYKGEDCGTSVSLTILGVENISWIGNGNSVSNTNVLDADPNYFSPSPTPATWPSAVRVFPDARAPAYSLPLKTVQLEVTLSVIPVEPVVLYARLFDVDDPTNNSNGGLPGPPDPNYLQFLDPNDDPSSPMVGSYAGTGNSLTYTLHEDNRSNDPKSGEFIGQMGNSAPITFTTTSPTKKLDFPNVSMHAGDNYRAVVNGDVDFLENLENLDERDAHKIVDKFVIGAGATPIEILLPLKYASPVLTVWRFLNVVTASMSQFNSDTDNTLGRVFADFISPTASSTNISALLSADNSLRFGIDPNPIGEVPDLSPVTSLPVAPCSGVGRFSDGEVQVAGQLPKANILSNNILDLNLSTNLNLAGVSCSFSKTIGGVPFTGTADLIVVQRVSPVQFVWRLTNIILPPGKVLTDFIMGSFRITTSPGVAINNANIIGSTITTNAFKLRTILFDDDARISSSLLPKSPSLTSMNVYNEAYLEVVEITGSSPIVTDSNLGDDVNDVSQAIAQISPPLQESPSYWTVYVLTAWQHHTWRDIDQNLQTSNGKGDPCQLTGFYEAPALLGNTTDNLLTGTHFTSNLDVVVGFNYSHIYTEVLREAHLSSPMTIAHEIGHQFGLGHGNNDAAGGIIPECGDPFGNCLASTMKLMAPSPITPADIGLIPRYQNLIRSRSNSPGY